MLVVRHQNGNPRKKINQYERTIRRRVSGRWYGGSARQPGGTVCSVADSGVGSMSKGVGGLTVRIFRKPSLSNDLLCSHRPRSLLTMLLRLLARRQAISSVRMLSTASARNPAPTFVARPWIPRSPPLAAGRSFTSSSRTTYEKGCVNSLSPIWFCGNDEV